VAAEPPFAVAAAALAAAAFLAGWVALHHGFYAQDRIVDTPVYQRYGDAMADGQVPYRDFRLEYPPAALPAFVVPSLIQADAGLAGYERAFGWLMAACGAVVVALTLAALLALEAGPLRLAGVLAFVAFWPLALGSVVLTRFDLWPAALTAGALTAFVAGRDRLGAGVLGAAVAAKLFPVVLVPLAAVWVWRRRGRRAALACGAIFAGILAAIFLPFAVLAPDGLAASIGRQLSRPLQIESLGAALLVALHHVAGLDVEMAAGHGSQNVAGALGDAVGAAATAVQAAALLAIWIAFARGPATPERLLRFAALALVAFVALGKVLSPQFLIWLVPVVPLVAGRRGLVATGLLGTALLLTQTWFPYRYWDYARGFDETVTWLVLARDLVLVGLLAALAWAGASRPAPGPARSRSPGRPRRIR
jgi:hypothetical protein